MKGIRCIIWLPEQIRNSQKDAGALETRMKDLIRFGCHDFLNAKPLIDSIARKEISHRLDLMMGVPSMLADMMQRGELDLGWIPSIEYANLSDFLIIPDISISSCRAVKSVVLISRVEIEKLSKIALDTNSRTSVAMVKILLKEYGIEPEFVSMPPDLFSMMEKADAALIIGDNALKAEKEGYRVYDLGEEWHRVTGLPFVHALLLVRPSFSLGDQLEVLYRARDEGLKQIERIVDEESIRLGLDKGLCRDYFEERIYYRLSKEEIEGLKAFYSLAKREGFLKREVELRFYE